MHKRWDRIRSDESEALSGEFIDTNIPDMFEQEICVIIDMYIIYIYMYICIYIYINIKSITFVVCVYIYTYT